MTLIYTKSHKISRQNLQFAQIFIQNFPLCLTGLHEKRPKSPRHAPSSEPRPFPHPSRQLAPQRPQKRKKAARFLLPPPSFQQLALLLLPDQRKTAPKGLHGEVRFAENELVDNFRRKQRQPGRLRYHAGVDADGFRQRLDVGVSPVVNQRLPVESSGKIQQQGRIASRHVEFYNPHHPEPREETCDTPGGEYFFRFEKVMK